MTAFPRIALALMAVALVSNSVSAQDFDVQPLTRPGDTVEITQTDGRRVRGKVLDLSPGAVTLARAVADRQPVRETVPAPTIDRIVRVDSLLNGTLIGLGAGLGAGFAPGWAMAQYCENESGGGCASWFLITDLAIGGIGAAIGAGIDGVKKETIYSARSRARIPRPGGPAGSLSELQQAIKPGQKIVVTDTSGRELRGTLAQISADRIALALPGGQVEIGESQMAQVQRVGDPLWNGALIGAGAGFGMGLLSMARCNAGLVCGAAAGPVILVESAVGAGLGVAIDAMHSGRKLVYLNRDAAGTSWRSRPALTVSPVFGKSRQGVMVALRF